MRGASLSKPANPHAAMQMRKPELRDLLRTRRRNVPATQRRRADYRICATLRRTASYRQATTIAVYLHNDGEPSLNGLFDDIGKRFVVPVVKAKKMRFAHLRKVRHVRKNRLGIAEPAQRTYISTRAIDLVLLPVVGFDSAGNRLGMGGGYYDRHFSYLKSRKQFFHPRLIGIAYQIQHVDQLPYEPWDIPVHGIVTDQTYRRISMETQP